MTKLLQLALLGAAVFAIPGTLVAGEVSEVRDVETFTRIVIESSADVTIEVGKPQRVEVAADDEYISRVITTVEDGTLHVSQDGKKWGNHPVNLTVQVQALEAVTIDGSGDVDASNIAADSFAVEIDGSGDVDLTGTCGRLSVDIDGSGDIDSSALKCKTAEIYVNGSGDLDTFASEEVTLDINGSGDVTIHGNPARIHPRVRGSGSFEVVDQ